MSKLSRTLIRFVAILWICNTLCCCGIPIETSKGTFTIDNTVEELRRNHQNPSRMIDELESDRRAEISDSIKRQDSKEDAARDKKLNELFEKQSNQTKFNELPAIGSEGAQPSGGSGLH